MRRLIMRIYMYFKGKEMWNAKMSEHLEITFYATKRRCKNEFLKSY